VKNIANSALLSLMKGLLLNSGNAHGRCGAAPLLNPNTTTAMNTFILSSRHYATVRSSVAGFAALVALSGSSVTAECPVTEVATGLMRPLSVVQSNQGNLIVSETGIAAPDTGRISIIDPGGHRRTLLSGLPCGIADVGDPVGPTGLFLRGRTLYLLIGVGDVAIAGPIPGTALPNPNPLSSPLFSSLLAVHFSANVEKRTAGLHLTPADQEAIAAGETVMISNKKGDRIAVELIADFPDYIPNPLPAVPGNVRLSNPFDLVVSGDQACVTDGGRNLIWEVDLATGAFDILASFPAIPNPLFNPAPPPPGVGGPFLEAVPTGIRAFKGGLLVTLFRGAPFVPGTSEVHRLDPLTGINTPVITGLKTAVDVLAFTQPEGIDYLVLQNASAGLFFGGPGHLIGFTAPDHVPTVLADCLSRPTSMTFDEKSGLLYITQLTGELVAVPLQR
jgi:hypothetical protein